MEDKRLYRDQAITETLEENYMPYAMSVIVSRAIPEIDGFKPSHRKILYTMYKMKLLKGQRTKSANVVGQTMKLNPHGDQAIYATMVRLAKGNESLLLPYVDSKGNFGKVTSRDMKFAAPRYTEVKLDEICEELFNDLDKNTVDFIDNYDGTMKEPTLLPTTFPNILANPNKGIAVGMASNFPSFNLIELCNTTIAYLKNPNIDLIDTLPAPDFPTAGSLIYTRSAMKKIYSTGTGSFKIRGKVKYLKDENMLMITEIPYTTTVEQIMDKIIDMVKLGKIKEINDIRDETDLQGLKLTMDLKRGTDVEKLLAKLYKFTPLEDSFACNMNLLIDGRPKVLGVKEILDEWIRFRRECIKRSAAFDKVKLEEKLHLLLGLQKVILDIDEAIRIIRETENDKAVIPNLMSHFGIDEIQANYVADIRLRSLNKEYLLNRISELDQLKRDIDELEKLMAEAKRIDKVIINDLKRVMKRAGKPRLTQLVSPENIIEHNDEVVIEDYNLKVFVTAHNYMKKVSLVSLRSSGDHKLKEEDYIVQELDGNNKDEILFFTNQSNVYKMKLHEIEDHKVSQWGHYLPNLLTMDDEEEVIYTVITQSYAGHMLYAFENGKVAKVPLNSYETKTNRKKLVKAYSDHSPLVGVQYIEANEKLFEIREDGKGEMRGLVFDSDVISEKVTKNTKGIQAFRMKKGSTIVYFDLLKNVKELREESDNYFSNDIPKSGATIDPVLRMTVDKLIK